MIGFRAPGVLPAETIEEVTVKMVHCPCGVDVSGESDDELVRNVQAHMEKDHPEQAAYSREQILALAHDH